jgi:nucleoid DNA-binding protein
MEITREQMIARVAEEADYWKKDVKNVFNALEKVTLDCFGEIKNNTKKTVFKRLNAVFSVYI